MNNGLKKKMNKEYLAFDPVRNKEFYGLRLLPTFRCQKNRFFFYFTKFKSVILSSVYKRKMLKISKSGRVIQKKRIFK